MIQTHKHLSEIIRYLNAYPLKGIKNVSFIKFSKLWNKKELKQHLSVPSLKVKTRLINLVKSINKIDEDRVP